MTQDYIITRDEDEPALLPSDTSDIMDASISIVTKSSGAIMIESPSLISEGSHELQEVSLVSHDLPNGSHDLLNGSHDPKQSHDAVKSESHEPTRSQDPGGSHEPFPIQPFDVMVSHELPEQKRPPEFMGGSHDLISEPLIPASHDLFAGSHDITEQLFEEDDTSSYRHRSLTAASISSTPYASLASTTGGQDDNFEVIPLVTGSKKKRTKKSGKKKKKQSVIDETDSAPVSNMQPLVAAPQRQPAVATPPIVQQQSEELPIVNGKYFACLLLQYAVLVCKFVQGRLQTVKFNLKHVLVSGRKLARVALWSPLFELNCVM